MVQSSMQDNTESSELKTSLGGLDHTIINNVVTSISHARYFENRLQMYEIIRLLFATAWGKSTRFNAIPMCYMEILCNFAEHNYKIKRQ